MKVILLAAGQSKRLKPIEDKNFLEFLGKPLILHQLQQLISAGLKDIFLVGGAHNIPQLKQIVNQNAFKAKITLLEQKDLNGGMAAALLSAQKLIKDEAILVVSANDIVDVKAYQLVVAAAKNKQFESFLLGKKVEKYFPGGYLKIKKNGLITDIIEKPGAGKEPSDLVNLVVHFHRNSQALFKVLDQVKSERDDRYEKAMDTLIKQGRKMKVVTYDNFWKPIKYPWDILTVMENIFLEKMKGNYSKNKNYLKKVEIAKSAILRGMVYLEEGVRVLENAVIVGPAYIGKDTIIATNALVRQSMIGAQCVIGFGTEITRSFIGNDVWTHSNYIGDSIIGNDCGFGAGTVTGNLRFDEGPIGMMIQDKKIDSGRNKLGIVMGEHVRCGINTSFMPGIKIGNNCFIGAGIVVGSDVPDQQLVYAKNELLMKENKLTVAAKGRLALRKNL